MLGGHASISVRRDGKQESIQVKIPPGVVSGKKMRLRGQGEPGRRGGAAGDLIITLTVANHPFFKRHGPNLELRLPVTLKEAILGAAIDVPTPSGVVTLKVPPGSSSGRRLRVKGQGVLSPTGAPGDLYVELQIKLPEQITEPGSCDDATQAVLERLEGLYLKSPREGIRW